MAGSKSHGTSNLLTHLKNCTKYPYRDTQGQQTLGFKPREVGGEGVVDVVATSFSIEVARRFLKRTTNLLKGIVLGHDFLHMCCCAHILNLIVSDGLKDLKSCIANVRHVVRYVWYSPNRLDTFKKYVESLKIESKSLLCLDVPTRWNSTYLMLEAAERFESAFQRMGEEDYNYKHYFLDNEGGERREMPTAEDWDNCRVFLKFLKMFYNATKRFFGFLFVTSNTFYTEIFVIENMIGQLIKDNYPILSSMAKKMKEKFDKYRGNGDKINLLLYIAVVLDHRRKMTYLQFCFSTNFGGDVVKVKEMLDKVKNCLNQFNRSTLELDKYLGDIEKRGKNVEFDILEWWKVNTTKYRVLSLIARDMLAMPVSTVVSESAFSTRGRILDPFRSSLAPKIVELLVCTQNLLRSNIPNYLRQAMDDVEEFEQQYDSSLDGSWFGSRK
ncbi:zinc finger BED domain-containing protein RICESLEEPER 2-like [Camellia sinensis]|uniref:zinc finger BED domain-containing protein RICESLEEPER 2-like n=1 Tax=Camellia sinensis TaxID=4442 RepID=UPI0010361F73|nr:zinc finger BED domain-containing protein RICESLEEPER 2-like [Camellia sinensis]